MIVAWLLFPLVLLAVCLGCGLALEWVSGRRLPGTLLATLGLVVVIVLTSLTTSHSATARLSTPVVIVAALIGYGSSWRRLRSLRPEPWALAVGLGAYVVYAAPVVASGNATFLGYFVLNDSAVHFALIDQLMAHGPNLAGLRNSAYSGIVGGYLDSGYPVGADVALGAIRPLVGQDVAWIFQPYMAVVMSLGGVALYELLRTVVASRPLRAACAFIAAQSGLVYAFYLEASIKELVTTVLITVTVVLVFDTLRRPTVRGVIPVLAVALAGFDVLGVTIVPWLGVPLAVLVVALAWRARGALRGHTRARLAVWIAAIAAVLAVLAVPIADKASSFFSVAQSVLTQKTELANLSAPLTKWEMLGIWPSGDFRFGISNHAHLAWVLIGLALASGVMGVLWMLRRRAYAPLLMLAGNGIATVYLLTRASPYAAAKVMMLFSLTAVLAAMLGAVALYDAKRRVEGVLLGGALAFGVLWTNALGYKYSSVAPRARFAELASIGHRFSGQGPTFFNLSEEFAIHFLRSEAPTIAYWLPVQAAAGVKRDDFQIKRLPWDTDELKLSYLEGFRLLVLGRSPRFSRPPANYQLVYQGRYYDVWRRTATPQVLSHFPLGSSYDPVAVPACGGVMRAAEQATRLHARLAFVAHPPSPTLYTTVAQHPPNWPAIGDDKQELIPREQVGALTGTLLVPHTGRYQVWLDGSLSQRFVVRVGGHAVGSVSYQLGPFGQGLLVGSVELHQGPQHIVVQRPATGLQPGAEDPNPNNRALGPVTLVADGAAPAVRTVAPSAARSLCGQSLDWIEVVRS